MSKTSGFGYMQAIYSSEMTPLRPCFACLCSPPDAATARADQPDQTDVEPVAAARYNLRTEPPRTIIATVVASAGYP
jgi:hypothetical protein